MVFARGETRLLFDQRNEMKSSIQDEIQQTLGHFNEAVLVKVEL